MSKRSIVHAVEALTQAKVWSWDVDGTLYDLKRLKKRLALRAAFRPSLIKSIVEVRRYNRAIEKRRTQGCDVTGIHERYAREALAKKEADLCAPSLQQLGLRPGVLRLLQWAQKRGLIQVVYSDYRADYKLEALNIESFFRARYEGEVLGRIKPDPHGFAKMIQEHHVQAKEVCHLGDGLHTDALAALHAGVRCLIVGRDFNKFEDLADRLDSPS
jgi:putative hydrolase of the HAD superfamily